MEWEIQPLIAPSTSLHLEIQNGCLKSSSLLSAENYYEGSDWPDLSRVSVYPGVSHSIRLRMMWPKLGHILIPTRTSWSGNVPPKGNRRGEEDRLGRKK